MIELKPPFQWPVTINLNENPPENKYLKIAFNRINVIHFPFWKMRNNFQNENQPNTGISRTMPSNIDTNEKRNTRNTTAHNPGDTFPNIELSMVEIIKMN